MYNFHQRDSVKQNRRNLSYTRADLVLQEWRPHSPEWQIDKLEPSPAVQELSAFAQMRRVFRRSRDNFEARTAQGTLKPQAQF